MKELITVAVFLSAFSTAIAQNLKTLALRAIKAPNPVRSTSFA